MMKILSILVAFCFFVRKGCVAQTQFLDKATIEYEVKSNLKKTMGNNSWEEMLKDKLPTFKTGYYTLTFADNKSIYKWDHWDPTAKLPDYMVKDDETDNWYVDHNTRSLVAQKTMAGSAFYVKDSLPKMEWRMTNESRVIAGFNCRKAVTKILDSVYVFVFYTDEIMLPGGPDSFNGLPGTILGITIPRLYTSWIATKVSVNGIVVSSIKPADSKKYYTQATLYKTITDLTKDWWEGDDVTDEQRQQKARFIWQMML